MTKKPGESKLQDADMQSTAAALVRAAKRARKLAEQTGTAIVVRRDGKLVREMPAPDKEAPSIAESA